MVLVRGAKVSENMEKRLCESAHLHPLLGNDGEPMVLDEMQNIPGPPSRHRVRLDQREGLLHLRHSRQLRGDFLSHPPSIFPKLLPQGLVQAQNRGKPAWCECWDHVDLERLV